MNILFHLGLHCTDDGLLLRSILQNRARLSEFGVSVPGPLTYRELFGDASTSLRGAAASSDMETALIGTIAADPGTHRVILSNDNFLCRSDMALGPDGLYPKAGKAQWLRNCLPSHEVEFAFALRNPAGLVPDLLAGRAGPRPPDNPLAGGMLYDDLRWAYVIDRIQRASPGARIIVWCHEDTPFIWSEIVNEITGCDSTAHLEGELDMVETIMTPEGYARLTEFLGARDVKTQSQRRRAVSAFLDAHALPDEIEDEIDLPGWTTETVETLTRLYDDDIEDIRHMDGVTFLEP